MSRRSLLLCGLLSACSPAPEREPEETAPQDSALPCEGESLLSEDFTAYESSLQSQGWGQMLDGYCASGSRGLERPPSNASCDLYRDLCIDAATFEIQLDFYISCTYDCRVAVGLVHQADTASGRGGQDYIALLEASWVKDNYHYVVQQNFARVRIFDTETRLGVDMESPGEASLLLRYEDGVMQIWLDGEPILPPLRVADAGTRLQTEQVVVYLADSGGDVYIRAARVEVLE